MHLRVSMKTDRALLMKGVRRLGLTAVLMFIAPIVLYEAFQNRDHGLFWPVLAVGLLLSLTAIAMGFYTIRLIVDAFFGKPGK